MSESNDRPQLATGTTEITLVTGERYCVAGNAKDVERTIVDAARGSIMQLAWLVDADTGADLVVNPEHVVLLRASAPETAA
jgi:3,4-dihydroxy-2-butanone 4-phosphate synthase